jgi:hypothetical protein
VKRKKRITPEIRARLVEAGRKPANIAALQAGIAERRSIREDVTAWKRDVSAMVDVTAFPWKRALIVSAAASYGAIALLGQQVVSAKGYLRVQRLSELLQPLQSELRRTLALLGISAPAAVDPADTGMSELYAYADKLAAAKEREQSAITGHSEGDGDVERT